MMMRKVYSTKGIEEKIKDILTKGGVAHDQIIFESDTNYVSLILPLNATGKVYFCVNTTNGNLFYTNHEKKKLLVYTHLKN